MGRQRVWVFISTASNRFITHNSTVFPLGHCVAPQGTEQGASQEEKERRNEMPELMWTLGLLLSTQ